MSELEKQLREANHRLESARGRLEATETMRRYRQIEKTVACLQDEQTLAEKDLEEAYEVQDSLNILISTVEKCERQQAEIEAEKAAEGPKLVEVSRG